MSADATNTTIDLKKRARRRLVGAVALALFAVIVLPLVMDSDPKPIGQDIQIRIPSQDVEAPATASMFPRAETPSPMPEADDAKASGAPAFKPVEPAADDKPAVVSATKDPIREGPAKDAPTPKSDAARAVAVLEGKDAGQWIVQLGAYRNAATVKTLTTKLKAMGLPVYTEKTDVPAGATRVRVGPFNSRESAENAKGRAKKIGVDGVVAPKQ